MILGTNVTWSQIAAWQLNGAAGNELTKVASTLDINLNTSSLARGTGLNVSPLANVFGSTNFAASGTKSSAISGNNFIYFSLNPKTGYSMSLSTLDARFRRSNTGPNAFRWQYSIDGTTYTDIGSADISYTINTTGGDAQAQIILSGVSALQNIANSTTVTLRLLGWGASALTGTFGIGRSLTSGPTDYSLSIGGTVTAITTSTPTKLAITSISPTTPFAGSGFSVTVESQDASGTATNVTAATSYNLTSNGNAGTIGGTLTGTIAAGSNSVTVTGVILPNAGTGVVLTSIVNTGDTLTAATSSAFNVIATSNAPTITSVTPGNNQLSVAFTAPTSDGGSTISNYKYSTNGTTFVAFSPAQTTSPILITGLTNGVSYPIQILAVNAAGDGLVSNTVSGIPDAPAIPTISASISTLPSALSTFYGTASSALSFTVSGSALTNDITLTAPAGFEISVSSASTGFTGASGSIVLVQNSGVVPTTTVYVRLIGTDAVGNYSGTISIVSSGATSLTVATISSTVSPKELTITGLSGVDKEYDTLFGATVSGSPVLNGIVSGDESFVALTSTSVAANFLDGLVATNKPITLSGYGLSGIKSNNYSLTLPSLSANITAKPITISNAQAIDKPYDGNLAAVITGQLTGVILPDVVTLVGTGTFATSAVAAGIVVTSTATITGTAATNYTLTQPTNLSASITSANQTITFGAIADRTTADTTFTLFATASSALPVTFSSTNTAVATVVGNVVTIVGAGTTTITASQAGDTNFNAATDVSNTLNVLVAIAKWTFDGVVMNSTPSGTPVVGTGSNMADLGFQTTNSTFDGLHVAGITTTSAGTTVWSTPAGNGSAKSLSSNFWAPGDYVQFKANASNYYNLALTYDQTGSATGPKEFKLQYSTDGTNFTDFGTTYNVVQGSWSVGSNSTAYRISFDLSTLPVLNNNSIVYFRVVNTSSIANNGGSVLTAGSSRLDNFTVIGSPCPSVTPTFSAAPFASTCISNNTTYTTETGQFNYVWTLPGVLGTDYTIASGGVGATDNSVTIHWLTSGVKAVTVSYSNSDGCTSATTSSTTTIFEVPTFTVSNPAAVCSPVTVNITTAVSNSALSYQYYTNSNATTVYATPTAATAGTYYIIGGNGTCYSATESVTVTVNALPTFTVTNPTAVCSPATVDITTAVSNSALSYQYYTNSNATTVYATPTAATAGTYYIIGGNGTCYSATESVTVTVNALPTVAAITGTTSVDTGATTNLASSSTGGVWSSSDMAVATVNPNGVVTGVSVGTATITYTITTGGCSNSQSVIVTVSALGTTDFDSASLSFYPNPTNDNLYLNYKEAISGVEMYNLLGQKVLEAHPNATFATLNVSNLSGGTYFVKITSGEFFTTIKVVKK